MTSSLDFGVLGVLVGVLKFGKSVTVDDAVLGAVSDKDGLVEVVFEEGDVGQDNLVGSNVVGDEC